MDYFLAYEQWRQITYNVNNTDEVDSLNIHGQSLNLSHAYFF